jgi:hypothetical protein
MAALEAAIAEAGGEDAVFERLADGERVRDIMRSFGWSRPFFYQWLDHGAANKERRRAKYALAKRASAEAYAEDAGAILDDLAEQPVGEITPALVALSGKRADYRKWVAGMRNPEEFGDKAAGLTVNIGTLHLDALRQVGSMTRVQPVEDAILLEPGDDAA